MTTCSRHQSVSSSGLLRELCRPPNRPTTTTWLHMTRIYHINFDKFKLGHSISSGPGPVANSYIKPVALFVQPIFFSFLPCLAFSILPLLKLISENIMTLPKTRVISSKLTHKSNLRPQKLPLRRKSTLSHSTLPTMPCLILLFVLLPSSTLNS